MVESRGTTGTGVAGASGAELAQEGAPRPFVIESRHAESDVITSFVLVPADGRPPLPHVAGQHLTLLVDLPEAGRHKRKFTISSAPDGAGYRISVKREPQGLVSQWLHDKAAPGARIEVAPPSGSFILPEGTRPVVMVSAGVGLTPMVAMLEVAGAAGGRPGLHFVHCTRSRRTQAFQHHVRDLAAKAGATTTFFHTRPEEGEIEGRNFDLTGRLSLDWLAAHTPVAEADYLVCGPLDFMRTFVPGLIEAGVPAARVHYEFFGAVDDLMGEPSEGRPAAAPSPAAPGPRHARALAGFAREAIGDALLDSAGDAIVASDAAGDIVLWNAGAERIFGFAEEEALGRSLDIIIPEPFRARHWEGYRETVATGSSRYGAGDLLAVPGLHRDGRRLSIEFTIVLLKDAAGKVTGMVAAVRDVTARFEETKALKKRLAALEEQAAG
uniref:PAS domain S-box protein n=1 Tax=Ancylobacter mangrovi TaxID=2972472 RepID=UPI002867FE21|nr:PAS domain S-box protein [Ancylobacter mangrovi]